MTSTDNRATAAEPATTFIPVVPDAAEPPTTALPPVPGPPRPPTSRPPAQVDVGIFRWLSPIFALMAVALLPIAAATTNLDALDGWGLGRVLSPAGWAAIVCAVAACVAELKSPRPRIPMLGTATGVLILCTTGMPSVVRAGRPVRHGVADRGLHRRDRHHRAHPARRGRPVLLARVLRAVGVLPRRGWRHPARPGAALVPARRRRGVDDRHLRAGPLDARRHPGAVGGGVAVRRPELDRAGLLLPAGHRHHPDAHRADVRARPAGHATHRRGGCARLALPAPGSEAHVRWCGDGSWRRSRRRTGPRCPRASCC